MMDLAASDCQLLAEIVRTELLTLRWPQPRNRTLSSGLTSFEARINVRAAYVRTSHSERAGDR